MTGRNPHIGSDFDDFLSDEGLLEASTALALTRVIATRLSIVAESPHDLPASADGTTRGNLHKD